VTYRLFWRRAIACLADCGPRPEMHLGCVLLLAIGNQTYNQPAAGLPEAA
jgi:hypothetical protein